MEAQNKQSIGPFKCFLLGVGLFAIIASYLIIDTINYKDELERKADEIRKESERRAEEDWQEAYDNEEPYFQLSD